MERLRDCRKSYVNTHATLDSKLEENYTCKFDGIKIKSLPSHGTNLHIYCIVSFHHPAKIETSSEIQHNSNP